jgi:hypothetical protein
MSGYAEKLTEGDWFAAEWSSHGKVTVLVADGGAVTGKRVIAECFTEADALVCAASKDLLLATQALLNALPSATTHPAIRSARAAIAKATGATR